MKRLTWLLLVSMLCFSLPAYAYEVQYGFAAEELWERGLFLGSNGSFNLDQPLTRVEGVTMIVRLLGKDAEAKSKSYPHPFSDVPDWADPYVGFCYNNNISKGISSTEFGSTQKMSAVQYLTLVLRALGYQDGEGLDFIWNKSPDKALEIGLIGEPCHTQYTTTDLFLRDNAAVIAFNALSLKMKGSEKTLESTITMPGRPDGQMPVYARNDSSTTDSKTPEPLGKNDVKTSDTNRVTLQNGHDNNNVLLTYQYAAGSIFAAQRFVTLKTGGYGGSLQITFSTDNGNDTRNIEVEANSTYAITYTYSVDKIQDTVIRQPDQQIMNGMDPITGAPKYITIPGTTTTIPAPTRSINLNISVSGGATSELEYTESFAGYYNKGSFKMTKVNP